MPKLRTHRIAKNTLLLYLRSLVMMLITLYTSRVVLATLGIEDFGIYDIVGGIVILFSFLNVAMSTATQRFLNYEMGGGDAEGLSRVFSMSMSCHIGIAVIMLILGETIGLWFVNYKLVIPEGRMFAANAVYQFSLLSFCVNIIKVPYNASIIAHERMSFYAVVSIVEALLRLAAVLCLTIIASDRLIAYGALNLGVMVIIFFVYRRYSLSKFPSARYRPRRDRELFGRFVSFTGWSLFGGVANVGAQQGINILLNLFRGVALNAAMGIANQVSVAVYSFVHNFQTAFNPQIVKSYAAGERDYFRSLVFTASKFSFYLLFVVSLPVMIEIDYILGLWLVDVPQYSAQLINLYIIFLLIDSLSGPLWMSVQASGKIKSYQITVSILILLSLPAAYMLLRLGCEPYMVLAARIAINAVVYIYRIVYMRVRMGFPAGKYVFRVPMLALLIAGLSIPFPLWVSGLYDGLAGLAATTLVSVSVSTVLIYLAGLTAEEKKFIREFTRIPRSNG